MKKIRLGIIGTGGISNSHVRAYKQMDDVEIVAGADIIPGKAREALDRSGLHAAMGFTEAGVLTDAGWKNGQWRDVVWMQKRLNESTDAPREVVPIGNIDVRDLLESDD